MAFRKTKLSRLAIEQIKQWALPDDIHKEVYLFLTEVLRRDVEHHLSREVAPFDGMITQFARRDPFVRGREHEFIFRILFGQDEETLIVERGSYHQGPG